MIHSFKVWLYKRKERKLIADSLKQDDYYGRLKTSRSHYCGGKWDTKSPTLRVHEIRHLIGSEMRRIEKRHADGCLPYDPDCMGDRCEYTPQAVGPCLNCGHQCGELKP